MARRQNSGILASWAEAQRRQKRELEAQQRAWRNAQEEQERARRAAIRAHGRDQREAWRAYQQGREADAAARTTELEAQVAELRSLLHNVLTAPPFRVEQLMREVRVAPFNPGPLSVPVVMPDRRAYQVMPPAGLRALSPSARREHQEARGRAEAQFEHDYRMATQSEEQRRAQLEAYHRQYLAWADKERQKITDHNAQVGEIGRQMASGDPDAVREFFTAALYVSAGWPERFPRWTRVAWDQAERQLIVDWELPDFSVVPTISRYRYIKSDDRETQIQRPAGERKALYRHLLAQSALAVLVGTFRADSGRLVNSATVNGFVSHADPVTGRRTKAFLVTVMAERHAFARLALAKVEPVSCLEGLHGQLSPRPEKPMPVHPVRLANTAGPEPSDGTSLPSADLMNMDPIEFEDLVAAFFQAMGMEVMTTARTGDGGVDVQAMDPDPVRGGKLVIQVKRYQNTIPPAPVRDLYGTMLHEGAIKGIFVTTAEFGPSAQEFAAGKPLTLIGGKQLADLLSHFKVSRNTAPRS